MDEVIKKIYSSLHQKTKGVSYKEQVLVTMSTIVFMLVIIIPLIYLVTLYMNG